MGRSVRARDLMTEIVVSEPPGAEGVAALRWTMRGLGELRGIFGGVNRVAL